VPLRSYDAEGIRELIERARDRTGLNRTEFARLVLVRDPATVRRYTEQGRAPRVVVDRLEQLARRRKKTRRYTSARTSVQLLRHA
jgi:hypothetical protein